MAGQPEKNEGDLIIYATHPAPAGTYILYVQKDGNTHREPVLCWGVSDNGIVVPLTLSGAWDGVSNENNCVLHPDGSCGKFEMTWPTMDAAVEALRGFGE